MIVPFATKFDGTKFLTCKVQLESLLITYGLDQFIKGKVAFAAQDIDGMSNLDYNSWYRIDNLI